MIVRPLVLTLLLALAGGAGCGRGGEPPPAPVLRLLVTQVPAAARVGLDGPEERYPIRSRLVLREVGEGGRTSVLSEGLVAAGGAALDVEGRRVLFTGKAKPGERWRLYATDLDDPAPRVVLAFPFDAFEPAWLPDGRFVFAGRTGAEGPLGRATALFVGEEGGEARRITFGSGFAVDPTVHPDGRVVFATWMPSARGRKPFTLFAVHPDGTGAWRPYGAPSSPVLLARPRVGEDGEFSFVSAGGDVLAREPAGDGSWVVTRGGADGGVALESATGARRLLGNDDWTATHAVLVRPREEPQGHLSVVDEGLPTGMLLALDARAEGGTRVRLARLGGPFAAGVRPPGEALGGVALEDDGSFFARVPADAPLFLEVVGEDGSARARCEEPFWVRPGEVRTCVGCHHDPALAPENRRPRAVLSDPAALQGRGGR